MSSGSIPSPSGLGSRLPVGPNSAKQPRDCARALNDQDAKADQQYRNSDVAIAPENPPPKGTKYHAGAKKTTEIMSGFGSNFLSEPRPGGPTAKRQPSPEGLGIGPDDPERRRGGTPLTPTHIWHRRVCHPYLITPGTPVRMSSSCGGRADCECKR